MANPVLYHLRGKGGGALRYERLGRTLVAYILLIQHDSHEGMNRGGARGTTKHIMINGRLDSLFLRQRQETIPHLFFIHFTHTTLMVLCEFPLRMMTSLGKEDLCPKAGPKTAHATQFPHPFSTAITLVTDNISHEVLTVRCANSYQAASSSVLSPAYSVPWLAVLKRAQRLSKTTVSVAA